MRRHLRDGRLSTITAVVALCVAWASLVGCGPQSNASRWTVVEQQDLTGDEQALAERISTAKQALVESLMLRLQETVANEGPVAAISVCATAAPEIAEEISEQHALKIGRTSFKRRNPANAPPAWAAALVAERVTETTFVRGGEGLNALLPIRVQARCLLCHGEESAMPAELQSAIDATYPSDDAKGFAVGDLRGWFWVECSVAKE